MRPTTRVCAKFESKGKPDSTLVLEDVTANELVIRFVRWLGVTTMGHSMHVTIARSVEELESASRTGTGRNRLTDEEFEAELLAAFGAAEESDGEEESK